MRSQHYPKNALFDIETLVTAAQPNKILLIGEENDQFLQNYVEQKALINQPCQIFHVSSNELEKLSSISQRFDVGIAINVFEHIDKHAGQKLLSKLRDILCAQYCICLPITASSSNKTWCQTDLFAFALSQVANHEQDNLQYAVYKYDINTYKHTPDWLNPDNWANPQMWNKYRW